MHHNGEDGLHATEHAVVDLHGTKTDIHSNKRNGIYAFDHSTLVRIHLPSQHNTSHGNVGEDRKKERHWCIHNLTAEEQESLKMVTAEVQKSLAFAARCFNE
jgi:hypothetical protein